VGTVADFPLAVRVMFARFGGGSGAVISLVVWICFSLLATAIVCVSVSCRERQRPLPDEARGVGRELDAAGTAQPRP